MFRVVLLGLLSALTFSIATPAQSPASKTSEVKEITTDFIVNDRKGHALRDLRPEDVEIYEDGVKQPLSGLRLVEGEPEGTSSGKNAETLPSSSTPTLVTMMFDDLHTESRKLAHDAALDFLKNGLRRNMQVGVYVLSGELYLLQPYTDDREKIRAAIELATGADQRQFQDISKKNSEALNELQKTTPSARVGIRTLQAFDLAGAEVRTRSWIQNLLDAVREQSLAPGRKLVFYFASNLNVPDNQADAVKTAVSEANLAGVAFFPVDVRSRRVDDVTDAARMQIMRATTLASGAVMASNPNANLDTEGFNLSKVGDLSFKREKRSPIESFAEGTSGTVLLALNDLKKQLRQIGDESNTYYIASYVPTKTNKDGSFRNLQVKVARPEAKVVSRLGYFALPRIGGKAAMPFEIPLLKAAEGDGKEKDFSYRLGVERLTPGQESRHRVTIDLPVTTFTVQNDQSKKKYQLHFGVLVAAIKPNGEIAGKISQDYPMSGNLDRVDNLKKSSFDFARTMVIPPGKYTLRSIVHDYLSGKTGIADRELIVPEYDPNLGLANLVLLPTNDKGVITSNKHILINPEEKVKVGKDSSLTFELGVFTTDKSEATLELEIARAGVIFARSSFPIPETDADGKLAFRFGLPGADFESGEYSIKARAKQGKAVAEETARLTIDNPTYVKPATPAGVGQMREIAALRSPGAGEVAPDPEIETEGITDDARDLTMAIKPEKSLGAAPVDVKALVREVAANGVRNQKILLDYTYRLRKVRHILNLNGAPTKEAFQDYEGYPVHGLHVLVKLADMGHKLQDWEVERERKRATDDLGKMTGRPTSPGSFLTAAVSGATRNGMATIDINPEVFLDSCDFTDTRLEMIGNRQVIAMDFMPRIDAKLEGMRAYVKRLSGTIWIDAEDKMLVRLEAKSIVPGVGKDGKPLRNGPEPKLVYHQRKAPTGEWYPSVIRLNAGGDGTIFDGLNWDVLFEFKDFRRFSSNANDYKLTDPKKP